jgi:FtsZ-binding cell division protein ZapB
LKTLLSCKEREVEHYRKRIQKFSVERIIQLEVELESQKEMNAILTQELEQIGYSIEHLRKAIELARKSEYEPDFSGGIQVIDKYDENEIIAMIIKEKHQI